LYSSPNIIRLVKSRGIRFVGNVAGIGEKRSIYRVFVGKSKESDHQEDIGVDERIVLKWIIWK
jgi:hypothetical protein